MRYLLSFSGLWPFYSYLHKQLCLEVAMTREAWITQVKSDVSFYHLKVDVKQMASAF